MYANLPGTRINGFDKGWTRYPIGRIPDIWQIPDIEFASGQILSLMTSWIPDLERPDIWSVPSFDTKGGNVARPGPLYDVLKALCLNTTTLTLAKKKICILIIRGICF